MIKLYWSPRSRSFSTLWLMEESGLPYERVLTALHGAAGIPVCGEDRSGTNSRRVGKAKRAHHPFRNC